MNTATMPRSLKVERNDWLVLPSQKTIQVCKIEGERNPVAVVRYLDDDGVMATGSFNLLLSWLIRHARKV